MNNTSGYSTGDVWLATHGNTTTAGTINTITIATANTIPKQYAQLKGVENYLWTDPSPTPNPPNKLILLLEDA
jgi:hypothetical protein